jgi:hypothetical protein
MIIALLFMRFNANIKRVFIMSYTYKGTVYSIKSPISSISVNKRNVVITDQDGPQLIKFTNVNDSKCFLAWAYQA